VIYQLMPRSFADADGDGIGDLAGITSKLPYLEWLGVDAIWLTPIYPSPLKDGGYDITDFTAIHPDLGDLDDLVVLLEQAHSHGIRVILDLVLNHTSVLHPWFQRARWAGKGSSERDFYVWRDDDKSGGPAYNAQRFLLYARDSIFECNATSGCDSTCYNRVVGRGIHLPLQVRKGVTRPSQTDPGPSRPRPAICVCSPAGARHPPQIPSASSGGSIAAVQGFRWPFCLCPDARAAAWCPDALARAQHSLDRHGAGSCTALALLPPLNSGREQ